MFSRSPLDAPGAAPSDARRLNRRLVLAELHTSGPTSRAALAKSLGLTPATVGSVVRGLIDDELLNELSPSQSGSVGKPATPVALHPDGRHIAVLDLSQRDAFVGAIVGLDGTVHRRERIERADRTGTDAIAAAAELTTRLVERAERPLLGVGVASPGVIRDGHVVVESAHLGWRNVDLHEALAQHVNVPVVIANDANAGAMGEMVFGRPAERNMLYVRIDDGLGVGIVLDGSLHVGPMGGGGELGHVVVDPDGPPCVCGKRGCLETVVSEPLSHSSPTDAVVDATGTALGAGLAAVTSVLDIDHVVVGGRPAARSPHFLDAVLAALRERSLDVFARRLTVRAASLNDDEVLLGAAALVMDAELGAPTR